MIYIVHGNDFAQTRKLINSQQKKLQAESKIEFEIDAITPLKLFELVSTFDIFGNPPYIVLDVTNAKSKDYSAYINVLINMPNETVVMIQSQKTLTKTNPFIKNAPELKAKIAQTEEEIKSNVFKFVDYLFYKDRKNAYKELQTLLLEGNDEFYILNMIYYGLRTVTQAKFGAESFANKSGFVKSKAEKQAANFTNEKLLDLYKETYKIEKEIKTGEVTPDIAVIKVIENILA